MARYDYQPKYGLENYTVILPLEDTFDAVRSTVWMQRNWLHSVTLSVAYVVLIYAGQKVLNTCMKIVLHIYFIYFPKSLCSCRIKICRILVDSFNRVHYIRLTGKCVKIMEGRKPFAFNVPLFLWNVGLALFSILGFVRMTPEWLWSWTENSFVYSICTASYAQGVTGFWTEQFAMSKVAELLDTAFIVLRKRPLLFLHWYHHVTVMIFTWHAYKDHTASGRWFIWMNYGVHAFMYTYYALRAMRVRLSKHIAMVITVLQISQMIMGIAIGVTVYKVKTSGEECQQTWENLGLCFLIYFTYFLLFCNFFYHAYLKKNNRYVSETQVQNKVEEESVERLKEDINANISATAVMTRNITRRRLQKID
ncbi:GNS1/SUR4 family protein [Dictyocaulus viviparus]|uniref:Elongation of very long chain fatty acids protein n=1 Tax=Dictyocaulus viviparus TaxID=29172 RepID=A0A0D8Y7U2_DICVI|nr:GNS1/SUR4 family protein [Dictyocaulus viviparus]